MQPIQGYKKPEEITQQDIEQVSDIESLVETDYNGLQTFLTKVSGQVKEAVQTLASNAGCGVIFGQNMRCIVDQFPNLTRLKVWHCGSDQILEQIGRLQKLVHLEISKFLSVYDDGFRHVEKLQTLKTFVSGTTGPVDDHLFKRLGACSKLETIQFSSARSLSSKGLECLGKLALKHLALTNCKLNNDCLKAIGSLKGVEVVDLSGSFGFTSEGLCYLEKIAKIIVDRKILKFTDKTAEAYCEWDWHSRLTHSSMPEPKIEHENEVVQINNELLQKVGVLKNIQFNG